MGKLSRSSGRGGAYLVGRPSSAGGAGGWRGWKGSSLRSSGRARQVYRLVNDLSSSGSFWHRTSRPRGGRGGEGGSMQTRRLLFKLNAATSEEDSLPGPLELGELPFISKRVGGGRLSSQASRRRRFFRISLLFLLVVARTPSSLPMDHTGFFGLGLEIYRWKEAFCVFVVFWLSNFGERINLGTPCLRFRKC